MTLNPIEIAANLFNAAPIFLAGRNSIHMWWTTLVGCLLFALVFLEAKLYADVTLQAFFILTAVLGWWRWLHGDRGSTLAVRHSGPRLVALSAAAGVAVTLAYGWLLYRFTDSYAPFLDSVILAFSPGAASADRSAGRELVVLAAGQHDRRSALHLARPVPYGNALHDVLDQRRGVAREVAAVGDRRLD